MPAALVEDSPSAISTVKSVGGSAKVVELYLLSESGSLKEQTKR